MGLHGGGGGSAPHVLCAGSRRLLQWAGR
jgi:hypothetical protein